MARRDYLITRRPVIVLPMPTEVLKIIDDTVIFQVINNTIVLEIIDRAIVLKFTDNTVVFFVFLVGLRLGFERLIVSQNVEAGQDLYKKSEHYLDCFTCSRQATSAIWPKPSRRVSNRRLRQRAVHNLAVL